MGILPARAATNATSPKAHAPRAYGAGGRHCACPLTGSSRFLTLLSLEGTAGTSETWQQFGNVKRPEAMRSREGGCGKVQTNRIEICLQILDLHIGIRSHETCPNSPPKRVQDRYNLSVPSVLFRGFGSPTVPQNQRDIPTPQPVTHEVAGSSPVVPAKSFESDMLHSWTARLFYSPSGVPPR